MPKIPKWLKGTGSLEKDLMIVTFQIAEILLFIAVIKWLT